MAFSIPHARRPPPLSWIPALLWDILAWNATLRSSSPELTSVESSEHQAGTDTVGDERLWHRTSDLIGR